MKRNARHRAARRRAARECLVAALVAILALALAAACRGQCVGGTCRPPTCWTQPPPRTQQRPQSQQVQVGPAIAEAVCRVESHTSGAASIGSGALVRVSPDSAFVLTCDHLFRDGVGRVTLRFHDGRASAAQVVARDVAHDLALLKTTRAAHGSLETSLNAVGQTATAVGLGSDGRLRAVRGRVVGRSTPQGALHPSLLIQGAVRSGDSGGPVINDQGMLVGVIWGVRGSVTYATTGEPVRRILDRIPATENRRVAQKPLAINSQPAPQCKCPGDCVQRSDLAPFVRRDELAGFATHSDLATVESRVEQHRGESRPKAVNQTPATASGVLDTLLPIAAAALGVGGPVGLAWLLVKLVWRRRDSRRRGLGGPRRRGFRAPNERCDGRCDKRCDGSTNVPVEPAAEPCGAGRHASAAPGRDA